MGARRGHVGERGPPAPNKIISLHSSLFTLLACNQFHFFLPSKASFPPCLSTHPLPTPYNINLTYILFQKQNACMLNNHVLTRSFYA